MTDNEIIKALEICGTYKGKCIDCPAFVKVDRSNCKKVLLGALDLINRQKAEIERLNNTIYTFEKHFEFVKAEAVKKFAERLKDLKHECGCNYRKKPVFAVTEDKIDTLAKEW